MVVGERTSTRERKWQDRKEKKKNREILWWNRETKEQWRRTARKGRWMWEVWIQRCELTGLDGGEQRGAEAREDEDGVKTWYHHQHCLAEVAKSSIYIHYIWIWPFSTFSCQKISRRPFFFFCRKQHLDLHRQVKGSTESCNEIYFTVRSSLKQAEVRLTAGFTDWNTKTVE